MRKRREAFSIPLLIGREAWTPSAPRRAQARRGAGAIERRARRAPRMKTLSECAASCRNPVRPVVPFWFVPRPGVLHPFPSRTRPLRPPAAMILRSRARESSAARTFSFQGPPPPPRGAGPFSLRAAGAGPRRRAGPPAHAGCQSRQARTWAPGSAAAHSPGRHGGAAVATISGARICGPRGYGRRSGANRRASPPAHAGAGAAGAARAPESAAAHSPGRHGGVAVATIFGGRSRPAGSSVFFITSVP